MELGQWKGTGNQQYRRAFVSHSGVNMEACPAHKGAPLLKMKPTNCIGQFVVLYMPQSCAFLFFFSSVFFYFLGFGFAGSEQHCGALISC